MPNLVPYVNTEEYYHPEIKRYYEFSECEINLPYFKLLHFEGIQNGKSMHLYLLTNQYEDDLAIIKLTSVTISDKLFYQINKSFSLVSQKGYGVILYNLCFQIHNGDIISDHINTLPGSFIFGKKY